MLKTTIDRVERSVNQLVTKGKITKEDAQRILEMKLKDVVNFQQDLAIKLLRTPEAQK